MSIEEPQARGEQRRVFARAKSAYSTVAPAFASSDTLRVREFKSNSKIKREMREDNRQTLGVYEVIDGIREGSWSGEMELQGSGALGTPWSCAPFLAAMFGTETINASTNVTYTNNDAQSALGWLDFLEEMNEVLARETRNAWLNEAKINFKGGQTPRFVMSGGVSDSFMTGSGTLNGAHSTSDTALAMVAGQQARFDASGRSRVVVGTSDNSSAGHTITSTAVADQITIAPGLDSAQDGVVVRPWFPAEAAPPSVISGTLGQVTVDGAVFDLMEGEVSVSLGIEPNADEAHRTVSTNYSRSWRVTKGMVKFRAYRDQIVVLQQRESSTARRPIVMRHGATAGSILELTAANCLYDFDDLDVPTKGSAIVTLPFICMSSDANTSDELVAVCR